MSESTAQDFDPVPTFHKSLRALMARADAASVPTGVLVTLASAPFGQGILRDGLGFADTVDQRQWETIYNALAQSRLPHAPVSFKPLDLSPPASDEPAAVSIGLLDMRYNQPSRRLMARILHAQRADAEIDVPDGPLVEERTAFVASALLPPNYWGFERQPDIHAGLDVEFHLDPAHVLSDAGAPDRIEVDFDDGQGPREWAVGGRHSIRYDAGGERRIVLKARYGAETRTAAFLFRAEPATAPPFNDAFTVEAKIEHNRQKGKCRIVVYYGEGNTRITRPFILAEGFPGGAKPADLYDRINGKVGDRVNPDAQLADALRKQGYDILLMLFQDGGAQLQGNAYAYLAALEEIWKRMGAKGEIVAAGGSMGGLIARYALAYAESNPSVPTGNVTTLMTFDSPHLGANVPYAVQCVARFFADHAPAQNAMLNLPAAKQMLVAQRWTWDTVGEPPVKDDFTKFYGELEKLGRDRNGYPAKLKRYATSNGAGDGTSGIQPGQPAVIWRVGAWEAPIAKGEAWAAANGSNALLSWCFVPIPLPRGARYQVNIHSRDGVAGGTAPFFGQLADAFRTQKGEVRDPVRQACFVPAHSALGYRVTDAYAFKPDSLKPGDVPFNAWYVGRTNDAHATVDKGIRDWVLNLLQRPGGERRFYISHGGRSLSGRFEGRTRPFALELLRPGVRLPLSLVGHTKDDADVCVLKAEHGGGAWYVSDRPVRGTPQGDVLELVQDPLAAVRLVAVFNEAARTVSFRRPGPSPVALTFNTSGHGVGFQPLLQQNTPPIIQHFAFEPASQEEAAVQVLDETVS